MEKIDTYRNAYLTFALIYTRPSSYITFVQNAYSAYSMTKHRFSTTETILVPKHYLYTVHFT